MSIDGQLFDTPDDGYWQSLLQDAEQAEDLPPDSRSISTEPSTPAVTLAKQAPVLDVQWQWAQEVFARDETVEGVVTGFNRGGLLIKARELAGFIPASHMVGLTRWTNDQDRAQQLGRRIGETVRLKVIELSREQNRFILSERLAMGRQKDGELLLHTLKIGDVCRGKVNHITEFGAFVDLGGIDGLIHVSEIAWERVSHPRDILRLGQEVQVAVVSIDTTKRRIQLSIKRLPPDPWAAAARNSH
jgi:small subunit ribosomal protein S1